MELATLVGGHGGEGVGEAGFSYVGGGVFRGGEESLVAGLFVVVCVAGDKVVLFWFKAAELGGEVLDCFEEFGVAGGEVAGVGARELDG